MKQGFVGCSRRRGGYGVVLLAVMATLMAGTAMPAWALNFDWDIGDGISGTLNTAITAGATWRLQNRDKDLIGKANLNPDVCKRQSCQGIFQTDTAPNNQRIHAPGSYSNNNDDGDLNYDKGDMTQAVLKLTQDLTVNYKDYGFFARIYGYYDAVNDDFTEYHPNRIGPNTQPTGPSIFQSMTLYGLQNTAGVGIPLPPGVVGVPTWSKGQVLYDKRRGSELKKQIGADLRLMDAYVFGSFPFFGDRTLSVKLGRQSLNFGESTALVINSLNQINPPDANNLYRVGLDLTELFQPVGMLTVSTDITPDISTTLFYQYEWEPIIAPAPGSFMSNIDVGSNNVGKTIAANFGSGPEDPLRRGAPENNILAGLTNTTTSLQRLRDNEPKNGGQYGIGLHYYATWLNNGTDIGLYAMNYHSRLPYASFYAADTSCAKPAGNALGIDAFDTSTFLLACPDLPLAHHITGDPQNAASNALPLDTIKLQLEYPENIQLYGVSFNTSFGDIAMQGELAYRPKLPIQISPIDLAFAALQPTLMDCVPGSNTSSPTGGCIGTPTSGPNTFTLGAPVVGDAADARRAFPSFVLPYRGLKNGKLPGNSYIRGWESFKSFTPNLGLTYIWKPSGIWASMTRMDQMIILGEFGAEYVPDLPDRCTLPLDGPGVFTHASAGADGSGVHNGVATCEPRDADVRSNPDGSDGLRFNPTQQKDGYPTKFSWGSRVILIPRWESVLPGISIQPTVLIGHDFSGTAPSPAPSFVEGTTSVATDVQVRYKDHFEFHVVYNYFTGGKYNLYKDRDNAGFYVKYAF